MPAGWADKSNCYKLQMDLFLCNVIVSPHFCIPMMQIQYNNIKTSTNIRVY